MKGHIQDYNVGINEGAQVFRSVRLVASELVPTIACFPSHMDLGTALGTLLLAGFLPRFLCWGLLDGLALRLPRRVGLLDGALRMDTS